MQEHQELLSNVLLSFTRQNWPALPNRRNHIQTGILVPILADEQWTCILTQRTTRLKDHSGEICFPGGKPDPKDNSLQETATREAYEELGLINPLVLTQLSSIPLYTSDYRLNPFLALFPEKTEFFPNPTEVQEVLLIPIKKILALSFIDGKPFEYQGKEYISPIFVPQKLGIDIQQPIFGGTAHVLFETITLIAKAMKRNVPPTKATFQEFPFSASTK